MDQKGVTSIGNTDQKIDILYIEDNEKHQKILKRILERNSPINFELLLSKNGKEGIKKLKEKSFDLILLDYKLPDINGLKVLEEIERNYNSHTVMVTSHGSEETAVRALNTGAENYIIKENLRKPETIMEIIENAFKNRTKSREVRGLKDVQSVFLVDDQEYLRELMSYMIKRNNELVLAGTFGSASGFYDSFEYNKPDVILLDIEIGEDNGIEIAEDVREEDKEATIIMCSALQDEEAKEKAFKAGADDFIEKPFKKEELMETIRSFK